MIALDRMACSPYLAGKHSDKMPRTSKVHYIAPSAVSITPNANGSPNDLAVHVARGTVIKVYSPKAGIDLADASFQEWPLTGRNRRLAESAKPYTIYARLTKSDKSAGYLVFAPKTNRDGVWVDKYSSVTPDGMSVLYQDGGMDVRVLDNTFWYVRLGDVSLPHSGLRTVTFDSGILGTDQYNEEWDLQPDELPLRVELGCTVDDEDAGPTPYVRWGKSLVLSASLVEGWDTPVTGILDHFEIERRTGDSVADSAWNHPDGAGSRRVMPYGSMTLSHPRVGGDDFNGAVAAVFKVTAWGFGESGDEGSSSSDGMSPLASASVTILAETLEKYELALSAGIVSLNPATGVYSPAGGVAVSIRATDQRGETVEVTKGQFDGAGLALQYAPVGSASWTALPLSGTSDSVASATIPVSAFAMQKSLNVRIVRFADTESSDSDDEPVVVELSRATVAFVRDGEDSKEREWIFFRSQAPVTFGGASSAHPRPSVVTMGQVSPDGAAGSVTAYNDKLDGWVPHGWYDNQQGVSEEYPYEYGSYRDFIHDSDSSSSSSSDDAGGRWGAFTEPRLWSHYAADGEDAVLRWIEVTPTLPLDTSGALTADKTITVRLMQQVGGGVPENVTGRPFISYLNIYAAGEDGYEYDYEGYVGNVSASKDGRSRLNYDGTSAAALENGLSSFTISLDEGDEISGNDHLEGIFEWHDAEGNVLARAGIPFSQQGEVGPVGPPGGTGPTGPAGADALTVVLEPETLIVEEGLKRNSDIPGYSGNQPNAYVTDQNGKLVRIVRTATARVRLIRGSGEIYNFTLAFDNYQGQNVHYSSNLDCSVDNTAKTVTAGLSQEGAGDLSRTGDIYLKVTFTEGNTTYTLYRTVKVYINRMGTFISDTVGDVTKEIRERTAVLYDENGQPKTVVFTNDLQQTATGILQTLREEMASANGEQDEYITTLLATARGLQAQVQGNTDGKVVDDSVAVSTSNYREEMQSHEVYLTAGTEYTLSARGTFGDDDDSIVASVSKGSANASTLQLTPANRQASNTFTVSTSGWYQVKAVAYPASGSTVTLEWMSLTQPSLVSMSTFEQRADHISLGVEGMSNGNILEETDWRGKTFDTSGITDRGDWNSYTEYHYKDRVYYSTWGMYFLLLGADTVAPGGDDPYHWEGDNPWVQESVFDAIPKISKWTRTDSARCIWVVDDAYKRMAAVHLRNLGDGVTRQLRQELTGKLTAGETYTLSLYYRAEINLHLNMTTLINTSASLTDDEGGTAPFIVNGRALALGVEDEKTGVEIPNNGNPKLPATRWQWRYVSITFVAKSASSRAFCIDAYTSYTEGEVTMLKLEKGAVATPWTELTKDTLKRSGLDIDAEKIVATTDHFEIQNSRGETTFTVDEDGNIKGEGNAEFAGTINARVLYVTYQKVAFTYTDIGSYNRTMTAARLLDSCDGGRLPQRLVLCSGNDNTNINMSADNNMNVYLPDAMDYEGMEIEIFFPSTYLDNNKKSLKFSIWCPQSHKVYHAADGSYTDGGAMPIKDGLWGLLLNRIYPSGGYISTAREMCKVRLRSTPVVTEQSAEYGGNTTAWEWVLLEKTNCMEEQHNP